jgi:hypothetical protein
VNYVKKSLIEEMVLQVLHHSECAETLHTYEYEKIGQFHSANKTQLILKNTRLMVLTKNSKEFIIADSELLVLGVLQMVHEKTDS